MTSRTLPTTATEIHQHLQVLRLEHAAARTAHAAALAAEIDATRTAYVGTAVTEIASLRAQLRGAQRG